MLRHIPAWTVAANVRRAPGRTRPVRLSTPCCSAETRRVGAAGPPAGPQPTSRAPGAPPATDHGPRGRRRRGVAQRGFDRLAHPQVEMVGRLLERRPAREVDRAPLTARECRRERHGPFPLRSRAAHRVRARQGWQPARRRRPAPRSEAGAAGRSGYGEAAPRLADRPPRPHPPGGRWRRGRRGSAKADRPLASVPRRASGEGSSFPRRWARAGPPPPRTRCADQRRAGAPGAGARRRARPAWSGTSACGRGRRGSGRGRSDGQAKE